MPVDCRNCPLVPVPPPAVKLPVKVSPLIEGEVAKTAEPEPVTAVIAVPLILKLLPVPAVSNVLFVNVSVVALPTSVSVAAGSVNVPEAAAVAIILVVPEEEPATVKPPEPIAGVVKDGEDANTTEPVPVTAVIAVPLILKLLPVPAVSKVLFVSVSVVALPTNVSVAAGSVSVPDAAAAA